MIERELAGLVREAIEAARAAGDLDVVEVPSVEVQRPHVPEHGDWYTAAALQLAKSARRPPRDVAAALVRHVPPRDWITAVEVAGPGFVNFRLSATWLHDTVRNVLAKGAWFGAPDIGSGERVNVEFVSINPTGPLHVGAGRNAAVGDSVARLLAFAGHTVAREYYLNDYGNQMELFGESVAARALALAGEQHPVPSEHGYQGTYVTDLAREVLAAGVDPHDTGAVREAAYGIVVDWIRSTVASFGIDFDTWYSERDLHASGKVDAVIDRLVAAGATFEQDGALWLDGGRFGDTRKSRLHDVRPGAAVLRDSDGRPVYVAADLAYHLEKLSRADRLVDVLGADHHAESMSLLAGLRALGVDTGRIDVIIYQFVHLLSGGTPAPMSKRLGTLHALDELIADVGADAARYTLLRSSVDNTLYFDVDVVRRQTMENPVYYVQYAHARISSIFRRAGRDVPAQADLTRLVHEHEVELMKALAQFEETVAGATRDAAPYRLTRYAEDLARRFHGFYDSPDCRVVTQDESLTAARLQLCAATRQVLATSLGLLGVDAPDRMEQ